MKRYSTLILSLGMILVSSCHQEEIVDVPQEREVSIVATASDTKTLLQQNAVMWEDRDAIDVVLTGPSSVSVSEFVTSIDGGGPAASAKFVGLLGPEVSLAGGFNDRGFAVYPSGVTGGDGNVRFTLPSVQTPRADGTFAAGLNLSSATVSLGEIESSERADARFRNAFSILRFKLSSDVAKLTLTGTAPLAGTPPLKVNYSSDASDGRLVIDASKSWPSSDKSLNVSLLPSGGASHFSDGTVYNLLVLPGTHSSLTLDITFASEKMGVYTKSVSKKLVFEPSKFYTLNFDSDADELVTELAAKVGDIEDALPDLEDDIDKMEGEAEEFARLLSQIQSVAALHEYAGNQTYAPYARQMYSLLKKNIKIDYMVRPAAAMESLLKLCKGDASKVFSAVLDTKNGSFSKLNVVEAVMNGDILTVSIDASGIPDSFYKGNGAASVALDISDGNTEILSEFTRLIPRESAVLNVARTDAVPVLKGARLMVPVAYAAYDMEACKASVSNVKGFSTSPSITINNGAGYIYADFSTTCNPASMSFTVTLTCGEDTDKQDITFTDGGSFVVETSGEVDYIGGEVSLEVTSNSFGNYSSELQGGGSWIYQTNVGNNSRFTVEGNTSSRRTATVVYTIQNGPISYVKSIEVAQKAYGTAIDQSRYHQNKAKLQLNAATAGYTPLNLIIVGDGYQKKDLQKGGKFERSARSACEAFFGVEPYKSFRDRFNVQMVAYESNDEGISIEGGVQKDTYFKAYCKGSGNTYVNLPGGIYTSVINVVKNDMGLSSDASYYRTIVLMLINTSEGIGSNAAVYRASYSNTSTLGEPYASFALAMVAANTSETSNLVRHEAGGHAFGRLGDEYQGKTYGSDLDDLHGIGWYRNVTTDQSKWNWNEFSGLAGYEDVTYYMPSGANFWCPTPHTSNSIMYNNLNMFNAPSRRIIFERIIRQTEGASAYNWDRFLEYDKKNI